MIHEFYSSEREYEETGSEGEHQEEIDVEGDEGGIDEEVEERIDEEQEPEEMESHQRNHIGKYEMTFKITVFCITI